MLNISAGGGRFTWDFVAWALSQNLTKTSVGFWRTQNESVRSGGCDGSAPADSSALTIGLGIGIPLALSVAGVVWLARRRTASGLNWDASGYYSPAAGE